MWGGGMLDAMSPNVLGSGTDLSCGYLIPMKQKPGTSPFLALRLVAKLTNNLFPRLFDFLSLK